MSELWGHIPSSERLEEYFAWLPTRTKNNKVVWFRTIYRQLISYSDGIAQYEYTDLEDHG